MLYREITVVCSGIHTEHVPPKGQDVKAGGTCGYHCDLDDSAQGTQRETWPGYWAHLRSKKFDHERQNRQGQN
jgi:hypothetical protein